VEEFIKGFLDDSKFSVKYHDKMGVKYKKLRTLWGLPPIFIPLIMAPLSQTFKYSPIISYISMVAFIISGLTSSIGQYFNYGKKTEQHYTTKNSYADLITDIKEELAKSRINRREAAVCMSSFKMRFDVINKEAPCY